MITTSSSFLHVRRLVPSKHHGPRGRAPALTTNTGKRWRGFLLYGTQAEVHSTRARRRKAHQAPARPRASSATPAIGRPSRSSHPALPPGCGTVTVGMDSGGEPRASPGGILSCPRSSGDGAAPLPAGARPRDGVNPARGDPGRPRRGSSARGKCSSDRGRSSVGAAASWRTTGAGGGPARESASGSAAAAATDEASSRLRSGSGFILSRLARFEPFPSACCRRKGPMLRYQV
jgi:hypothetical protein